MQPDTCTNMGLVPAWQTKMAQVSRSAPLGSAPPLDPTSASRGNPRGTGPRGALGAAPAGGSRFDDPLPWATARFAPLRPRRLTQMTTGHNFR